MSNYQFVVFSGKNKNKSIIKQEDVESETDELLSENQREVDSPSSSSLSIASSSTSSTSSHKQLIVLTTSSDNVSNRATIECDSTKRKTNNVEKQQASSSRKRESSGNIFQVHIGQNQLSVDAGASQLGGKYTNSNAPGKAKIPRPANAFMLFANEWRRKLANENPRESNKDISVRLVPLINPSLFITPLL
ncbi:putative transcription factor capicua [Microplitis mediator]|uniref:putative transcription factor capicua n=1 Tax=Microplitis mediator TaxID=375433 RepID=UPI0025521021|nr:putative transcription factor capicua [Microplitis mediator]